MKVFRVALVLLLIAGVGVGLASRDWADAQAQTIKIGLLYDHTGPFSAAIESSRPATVARFICSRCRRCRGRQCVLR